MLDMFFEQATDWMTGVPVAWEPWIKIEVSERPGIFVMGQEMLL